MVKQLCVASTYFGAATLVAAIDAGMLPLDADDERILVVTNNAAVPEATRPFNEAPGAEVLLTRFDRVLSWNDTIAPFHPRNAGFRAMDRIIVERLLRSHWRLGDDHVEIAAESIHINPAREIAEIFAKARIHVYADGLMSYGPTRDRLPAELGGRVDRLLYLDLVPALQPLLLTEFDVPSEVIPRACMSAVFEQLCESMGDAVLDQPTGEGRAVILGQYLAALQILTGREEEKLHREMIDGVANRGMSEVLFKPHPTAPPRLNSALEKRAAELGLRFSLLTEPVPFEAVALRNPPDLVVACFSTGLATARRFLGCDVAHHGTDRLLGALEPYENNNRIPLTIIDATTPPLYEGASGPTARIAPEATRSHLVPLVHAVSFFMQPVTMKNHRDGAARYVAQADCDTMQRYFAGAPLDELSDSRSRLHRLVERSRVASWAYDSLQRADSLERVRGLVKKSD